MPLFDVAKLISDRNLLAKYLCASSDFLLLVGNAMSTAIAIKSNDSNAVHRQLTIGSLSASSIGVESEQSVINSVGSKVNTAVVPAALSFFLNMNTDNQVPVWLSGFVYACDC